MSDYKIPNKDLESGHQVLQNRWSLLKEAIEVQNKIVLVVNEVYRSDERQQWLYGAGRSVADLALKGIRADFARPTESKVTNAWSAATSAHGYTINGKAASVGMDVVPVGADGKPWTKDDDWDLFVRLTDDINDLGGQIGLIHFHAPGKEVWDKPHLQLIEWNDSSHTLGPIRE